MRWLRWNVNAIGIGRKRVAGVETGVWCVQLFVDRKLPKARIGAEHRIPTSVAGLPTDVVESPRARLADAPRRPSPRVRTRRKARATAVLAGTAAGDPRVETRPVTPGCSIGHVQSTTGTLGAFCTLGTDPKIRALGNCHVLADFGDARPEDEVVQPGPAHRVGSGGFVARVDHFRRLVRSPGTVNRVDLALARMRATVPTDPAIPGIGRITGTLTPTPDLAVRKRGCMSGLTHGKIVSMEWRGGLSVGSSGATIVYPFERQLRIDAVAPSERFAVGGDSGSLVVTEDGPVRAVGLLCAAAIDGSFGIASPIDAVLDPAIGFAIKFL